MSIVYPRYKVTAGDPLDGDAVSDILQDFASEIDGNLGEQNWDQGGFTSLDNDMEVDAVARLDHYAVAVDWTTLNGDGEPAYGQANRILVPMILAWSSLIRRSLTTCRGGTYRMVASFQLDAGQTSNAATYWQELAGCTFAFRVDGAIYEESTAGGVERSNDATGEAVGWDIGTYTMTLAVPLPPGNHIIELVGRPARVATAPGAATTQSWSPTSIYEINNHEMWIEEDI